MRRIKFYSADKNILENRLQYVEDKLIKYKDEFELGDINDLIEIYSIKKYFDNGIYLLDWGEDKKKQLKGIVKSKYKDVAKWFNKISDDDIISNFEKVDKDKYLDEFWSLIEIFKVYEKISKEKFEEMTQLKLFNIKNILNNKNITKEFGEIIRKYMLTSDIAAEILLEEYEIEHIEQHKKYYFPNELTNKDKETIINNYIDSEKPNLNLIILISNIQSNKERIELSPKIILKAIRKKDSLIEKLSNLRRDYKISVGFSENIEKVKNIKCENNDIIGKYSLKWINENLDYATLLNNYIYLFDFVDIQMRSNHINKKNNMNILEILSVKSKESYTKGGKFELTNSLAQLQMRAYYIQLSRFDIRMEEIIEWFFMEYVNIEFNIPKFSVSMPSKNTTFFEKCNVIMPALDYVLKQFSLFVEDKELDFDLLNIKSSQIIYKDIPSLIKRKYVYGKGDIYNIGSFLLFSDQSMLGYSENAEYDNFYELIKNEKFKLIEFKEYNLDKIKWLLKNKFIIIKDEIVQFRDIIEIEILRELYFNEVISYWYYSNKERCCIDYLENRGIVEFKNTLFSKPEAEYINYLLNKKEYNNGLDLRNKYSHIQPYDPKNQRIHEHNYMIFFRILILTIIKINDDLCISQNNNIKFNY